MARLTALPSIDIIRGFRGILDFYLWKGLPCVRAWPRGKGLNRSDAEIASAALFGAVIKSYNLVGDIALSAYREMAAGIPRTPRDIMVSGVYGYLHQRTVPPPPPPPPEITMTGPYLNPENTTYSGSGYAWKGNYAKPMRDITLEALGAKGDWPQGITLKFGVFTVAAGLIATIVYKSPGVSLPAALDVNPSQSRVWETFDPPWALDAGTLYLIIVGRSDGADNYALPLLASAATHVAPFPAHEPVSGLGRIAKADPQVGDAVSTVAGTHGLLATWHFT